MSDVFKANASSFRALLESRDSCFDCVLKHLGQAAVLMEEALQGYPHHRWLAVGHLAEAAAECIQVAPKFAQKLRRMRLAYMADPAFQVPIVDLIAEAAELRGAKGHKSGCQ